MQCNAMQCKTIQYNIIQYKHRITVINQQDQKLQNFSANTIKLHNSITNNNLILKKIYISDMHHRTTYMHSNFQQNWVRRSVKTVQTNLF